MRYFISTGELSGDLHGSYLCEEIKKIDNEAKIYAIGGKNLEKVEGVEIYKHIDQLAIMGFVEVLKNISMLKRVLEETFDFIVKNNIDRVVLVDYGGFNLKLLERLKKEKPEIRVSYYIPPKVWIWGKKRVHKIKLADDILVIFPWEKKFYDGYGIKVNYFGNPFMEKYKKREKSGDKILLLPGSRKQEIQSLIGDMLEVVRSKKDEKFLLKLAKEEHRAYIDEEIEKIGNLEINYDIPLKDACEEAKYAIAASGTVMLELAIIGLPGIAIYKTSFINALIFNLFIKAKYVTLPNLTLDEEVYVELLQEKCTPDNIIRELDRLEANPQGILAKVEEVRAKLNGKDILKDYAKVVVEGTRNV